MARTVMYSFPAKSGEGDYTFDVEAVLSRAKRDGTITNYDDGRNRDPWFEGKPGPALRVLRESFAKAARAKGKP